MKNNNIGRIIGVDPGSRSSGMVVLDGSDIIGAFNLDNEVDLFSKISKYSLHSNLMVVIEDIKPYTLRLTPDVIDTCKFIGMLVYRLKIAAGLNVELLSRFEVKKWCFDRFPHVCMPLIEAKINKKLFEASDIVSREVKLLDNRGKPARKGSFIYCDDKIVIECMKDYYSIPVPEKRGKFKYGLKTHSFQALALVSCFNDKAIDISV